jgi:hypothetical protein
VMISLVSCRVSFEVHINGRRVAGAVTREAKDQSNEISHAREREGKRAWVMTSAGREVVRPGYTMHTSDHGHGKTFEKGQSAGCVVNPTTRGTSGMDYDGMVLEGNDVRQVQRHDDATPNSKLDNSADKEPRKKVPGPLW